MCEKLLTTKIELKTLSENIIFEEVEEKNVVPKPQNDLTDSKFSEGYLLGRPYYTQKNLRRPICQDFEYEKYLSVLPKEFFKNKLKEIHLFDGFLSSFNNKTNKDDLMKVPDGFIKDFGINSFSKIKEYTSVFNNNNAFYGLVKCIFSDEIAGFSFIESYDPVKDTESLSLYLMLTKNLCFVNPKLMKHLIDNVLDFKQISNLAFFATKVKYDKFEEYWPVISVLLFSPKVKNSRRVKLLYSALNYLENETLYWFFREYNYYDFKIKLNEENLEKIHYIIEVDVFYHLNFIDRSKDLSFYLRCLE